MAYVAYYLHWSLDSILDLEHPLRRRFIDEISTIHADMAGSAEE